MRIIFVRHGHPDYVTDSLTELGHLQAEAAAKRLSEEKIDAFYSSSCGRAAQTAEHIAAPRGMKVELLDFMRELYWGSVNGEPVPHNGGPWDTSFDIIAAGLDVTDMDWAQKESFSNNTVVQAVKQVVEGLDPWMETLGLKREGLYYRIKKENPDTILLAGHAGSFGAALGHILNIAFPYYCACLCPKFTAISILTFEGKEGALVAPMVEILNDATHIADISTENFMGN